LDVGTLTITGQNTAGTDSTISVPKLPSAMAPSMIDSIGRKHDIFYQTIVPSAEKFLKPDSFYTIQLGGAGNIPATGFKDQIYLAKGMTVMSPDLEDNGPLKANTDYTVHWTPGGQGNAPAGTDILGVTWLVDSKGSPTHMCPVLESAGQFTIPAATIAEYRQVA